MYSKAERNTERPVLPQALTENSQKFFQKVAKFAKKIFTS